MLVPPFENCSPPSALDTKNPKICCPYIKSLTFEKGSNGQNHSTSDSHHPIEKFPQAKFPILPPLNVMCKTLKTEILFQNNLNFLTFILIRILVRNIESTTKFTII